jgi:hypothetical protein
MNGKTDRPATASDVIVDLIRRLRSDVGPSVSDGSALDALEAVIDRLDALAGRIECEGEILWADIADQRLLLTAIEQEARHASGEPWAGLALAIEKELDRIWHTPAHYPALASLQEENRRLGLLIDEAENCVASAPDALGEGRAQRMSRAINGYLRREAERKAPLADPLPARQSQSV